MDIKLWYFDSIGYGKSGETVIFLTVSILICGKLHTLQLLKLMKNLVLWLKIGNDFEMCE